MLQPFTVADCVATNARSFPDRCAIEVLDPRTTGSVEPIEAWSYGALWGRTEALADALGPVAAGPHGPMAGLLLPNGADHAAAYLACQLVGAAAVPVNSRLAEPEIRYVLEDSGASVLLAAEPFIDIARRVTADLGIRLIDAAEVPASAPMRWSRPIGPHASSDPRTGRLVPSTTPTETTTNERAAMIAYTSGTTGFPKGSINTNAGFLTRLMHWSWTFGLTAREVVSTPGPMFHLSYGGLTLAQLVAGGRARVMTAFEPQAALAEYARHSTWAFLVPSMTAAIAEAWRGAGRPPLEALRYLLSAGAPGPMSLLDEAFDVFPNAEITDGYGWTEAGWVTYEIKDRSALVPHCVGGPTPGSLVKVVDPETCEEVSEGSAGEVVAMSVVPFEGYLGRPEATKAAFTPDGFARSGDMGIMAADGRLAIVDRVKDMIISGGENVYCAEVERVLVEHPEIAEAAVVGLPDERWGERVVAAVVPHEGQRPEPAEVIAFVRDRLAHYKCPRELMVVGELPRNAMGKVLKPLLAQQFGSEAPAPSSNA